VEVTQVQENAQDCFPALGIGSGVRGQARKKTMNLQGFATGPLPAFTTVDFLRAVAEDSTRGSRQMARDDR